MLAEATAPAPPAVALAPEAVGAGVGLVWSTWNIPLPPCVNPLLIVAICWSVYRLACMTAPSNCRRFTASVALCA
ncbi:hypothetical protein D3C71_2088260 [compost metagenome]